jgi:serine/threonine protein kinase
VKPPATYNYLSDIWSFGLVMYELAIGDHPYKMLKDKPILHKILHLLEEKEP